jgi:RNA polymerase sigma-70 factor (ECF subfamily)
MSIMTQTRSLEISAMPRAGADVAALFKDYHGFVHRALIHLGVAAADQADVLQEVFLVVHRRAADYRDQDKPRAWLYAIAARVARSHRRRAHRWREQLTDTPPELTQAPAQQSDVATREAVALAQRLLGALPPEQLAVFMLFEVEQMAMPEVAAAVGCGLATAHARLRLARARVMSLVSRARLRGDVP